MLDTGLKNLFHVVPEESENPSQSSFIFLLLLFSSSSIYLNSLEN